MEDQVNLIESLLQRGAEYVTKSIELSKLKAVDKTSDIVSTLLPRFIVFIIILISALFISLGAALWLGGLLGNLYYGFFLVASFYGIAGIVVHFFMQNWLKKVTCDYFIRQMLK